MNEPASFCDGECDHNDDEPNLPIVPLSLAKKLGVHNCEILVDEAEDDVERKGVSASVKKVTEAGLNPEEFIIEEVIHSKPMLNPHKPFSVNNPPYAINNFPNHSPLNTHTISMDAIHYGDIEHYDAHSLYGTMEAQITWRTLAKMNGNRPFVLSRSNFLGSGKWCGHWGGDNRKSKLKLESILYVYLSVFLSLLLLVYFIKFCVCIITEKCIIPTVESTWESMQSSIPQMLSYSLFSIPLFGCDIGGFQMDTSLELMCRWAQLGAFYLFSRNHSDVSSSPQEYWRWPEVISVAQEAYRVRYSLLAFWYTLFWKAHSYNEAVIRPLWWEFPQDMECLSIDRQFMVGNGLLITPVLEEKAEDVEGYFCKSTRWFDFYSGEEMINVGNPIRLPSSLNCEIPRIPIHTRGGVILPLYTQPKLTVEDTIESSDISLMISFNSDFYSQGDLWMETEEGSLMIEPGIGKDGWLLNFIAKDNHISSDGCPESIRSFIQSGYLTECRVCGCNEQIYSKDRPFKIVMASNGTNNNNNNISMCDDNEDNDVDDNGLWQQEQVYYMTQDEEWIVLSGFKLDLRYPFTIHIL